jgi:hypothetical protein
MIIDDNINILYVQYILVLVLVVLEGWCVEIYQVYIMICITVISIVTSH